MLESIKNWQGYRNELTEYLDEFIVTYDHRYTNYIYDEPVDNYWLIRLPGATRGRIKVNEENVIQDIELYEDSFCYAKEVFKNLNQFIGRKLIMY